MFAWGSPRMTLPGVIKSTTIPMPTTASSEGDLIWAGGSGFAADVGYQFDLGESASGRVNRLSNFDDLPLAVVLPRMASGRQ